MRCTVEVRSFAYSADIMLSGLVLLTAIKHCQTISLCLQGNIEIFSTRASNDTIQRIFFDGKIGHSTFVYSHLHAGVGAFACFGKGFVLLGTVPLPTVG